MGCFGDVATYVGGPSVLGMKLVAHEVEASDGEAAGYISVDMSLLEAGDVNLFFVCYRTDHASLGG